MDNEQAKRLTEGTPKNSEADSKETKPTNKRNLDIKDNKRTIKGNEFKIRQDDSEHALANTKILNEAYSEVFGTIFGKYRYFWLIAIIICFIFTRFDFSLLEISPRCLSYWQAAQQLTDELLNAFLWLIVFVLAVFPSMRQLKNIVAALVSKLLK